jgi:hypothetical protein
VSDELTIIESIQRIALLSVLEPDRDSFERRMARWYSSEFSTPLKEVETIPFEELCLHYFEHLFGTLDKSELQKYVEEFSLTPEEAQKKELEEEIEAQELMDMVAAEEDKRIKEKEIKELQEKQRESLKKAKELPEITVNFAEKLNLDRDIF